MVDRLKLVRKSILSGITLTIIVIILLPLIGNRNVSKILLFPASVILSYLMGERPPMGYIEQGEPFIEGSPGDAFLVYFALFFQVIFYSAISFLVFLKLKKAE